MNYNLVTEHWMPVLFRNGAVKLLGIKETLLRAHDICHIAATNPMDRLAVIRFLLAILYWCKGNPVDMTDTFPPDWFDRLDDDREMFELFGDEVRFCQHRRRVELKTANYLINELSTGTNHCHFRHTRDNVDGICPACCAMGIIRLPVFATQGGRGSSPGINSKPPVYVVPIGTSLFRTLVYTWKPIDADMGRPFWEYPAMGKPKGNIPILLGLTWFGKELWLEEPTKFGTCANCGKDDHLVMKMTFDGLGSLDIKNFTWTDPHVIYETKKGERKPQSVPNYLDSPPTAESDWQKIKGNMPEGNWWLIGFSSEGMKFYDATERFARGD